MMQDEIQFETSDEKQKIWRYMDFSKYVDLVTTCELHFARADSFEDIFDCSSMQFFSDSVRKLYPKSPQAIDWINKINTFSRLFVYLNCWHINNVESAALWKLYSVNKGETIAIQTTFGKLKSEVENKWPQDGLQISKVHYDPENAGEKDDNFPGGRLFSPEGWEEIIYKRKSFAHEQELRAIIFQRFDKQQATPLKNEARYEEVKKNRPPHIRINIDPSNLIEKVYVSPFAKDLFLDLVKKISGKLGDRVQKSNLYDLY